MINVMLDNWKKKWENRWGRNPKTLSTSACVQSEEWRQRIKQSVWCFMHQVRRSINLWKIKLTVCCDEGWWTCQSNKQFIFTDFFFIIRWFESTTTFSSDSQTKRLKAGWKERKGESWCDMMVVSLTPRATRGQHLVYISSSHQPQFFFPQTRT